ncbi:hypothetical protein M8J75_007765 [Diaphorina citri]|nr:hypothetical protein M8J75_007765 [Diaphorina citri]
MASSPRASFIKYQGVPHGITIVIRHRALGLIIRVSVDAAYQEGKDDEEEGEGGEEEKKTTEEKKKKTKKKMMTIFHQLLQYHLCRT